MRASRSRAVVGTGFSRRSLGSRVKCACTHPPSPSIRNRLSSVGQLSEIGESPGASGEFDALTAMAAAVRKREKWKATSDRPTPPQRFARRSLGLVLSLVSLAFFVHAVSALPPVIRIGNASVPVLSSQSPVCGLSPRPMAPRPIVFASFNHSAPL